MAAATTAQVIHPATGPAPSTLTGQLLAEAEEVIRIALSPKGGQPTDLGELLKRLHHLILGEPFDDLLQTLKGWFTYLESIKDAPNKVALTTTADSMLRMHRRKMITLVRPWTPAIWALFDGLLEERYITIAMVDGKPVVFVGEKYPCWEKY